MVYIPQGIHCASSNTDVTTAWWYYVEGSIWTVEFCCYLVFVAEPIYEGHSINKLQNGAVPLIFNGMAQFNFEHTYITAIARMYAFSKLNIPYKTYISDFSYLKY